MHPMSQAAKPTPSHVDERLSQSRPNELDAEEVDWSAVRSYKREQRKYGHRKEASTSSMSSISSGLSEDFSSSSSESSYGNERVTKASSLEHTNNSSSGITGRARLIWLKHRAKKLFLRFTTPSRHTSRTPAWQRRKRAAAALMKIVSEESGGEDIVARRFVKTTSRQERGTRAIFSLGAEECDLPDGRGSITTGAKRESSKPISLKPSGVAVPLLNLVILHSDGRNFFQATIPDVLQIVAESSPAPGQGFNMQASPAITYLARTYPNHFIHMDLALVRNFGAWLITRCFYPSIWWLRGIAILNTLISPDRGSRTDHQELKILVAKEVLQLVPGAIDNTNIPTSHYITPTLHQDHPLYRVLPLQAAVNAFSQVTNDPGALSTMITSPHALRSFAQNLIDLFTYSWVSEELRLAIKLLALMRNIPVVQALFSKTDDFDLASRCIAIALYQLPPQQPASKEETTDYKAVELKSDEDAFDVLCSLKEGIFGEALRAELQFPKFGVLQPGRSDNLRLLEPLLWLSNIRENAEVTHRALTDGGSCQFLAKIVATPVSSTFVWGERDTWRAKGQAMICLGNIIERMDASQLREHVTEDMICDMVKIYTDDAAPLSERDHARFTLQRYTAATDRSGAKPHYRIDVTARVE
ncbi:hypothetical protein FRB90_001185 [Tulasnella sp. 427]|nr:hypothetical protein FRB90_001185 [Tulasnella sp. 427]